MMRFFIILTSMLASCLASAFVPSTMTLTVINQSDQTFTVNQIKKASGNVIEMNNTIPAHKTSIITGTITTNNDLSVEIVFLSGARLSIRVRRQMHTGQPVLYLDAPTVSSTFLDRKTNPIKAPRLLSYTEARIKLNNKQ